MSYSLRTAARALKALASLTLLTTALGGAALLPNPARADFVVTAGADKKIKIWSPDGKMIKEVTAHDGAVNAVAISPDGKLIATGGADKKIKIWNADGTLVREIPAHDGEVTALNFSILGKRLVSGGADKKVKVWNVADGKLINTIDAHDSAVIGVFDAGEMMVSGAADGSVKIWSPDGQQVIEIPTGHTGGLKAMSGNAKEQMLYTAGADGKIKYWSRGGQGEFDGEQGSAITALYTTPDGKKVISGGSNGKVKIWDAEAHKALITIDDANTGGVLAIVVTPDGKMIATGGADKKIKIWTADGKPLQTVDAHDGAVKAIVYYHEQKADEKPVEKAEDKK